MSNLHCPNCNHLIGRLDAAPTSLDAYDNPVEAWIHMEGWEGWQTTEALYPKFAEWAVERGLDPLSRRRFSVAAVAAGIRRKRLSTGRLYATH